MTRKMKAQTEESSVTKDRKVNWALGVSLPIEWSTVALRVNIRHQLRNCPDVIRNPRFHGTLNTPLQQKSRL
jgi:hypothetical protein